MLGEASGKAAPKKDAEDDGGKKTEEEDARGAGRDVVPGGNDDAWSDAAAWKAGGGVADEKRVGTGAEALSSQRVHLAHTAGAVPGVIPGVHGRRLRSRHGEALIWNPRQRKYFCRCSFCRGQGSRGVPPIEILRTRGGGLRCSCFPTYVSPVKRRRLRQRSATLLRAMQHRVLRHLLRAARAAAGASGRSARWKAFDSRVIVSSIVSCGFSLTISSWRFRRRCHTSNQFAGCVATSSTTRRRGG